MFDFDWLFQARGEFSPKLLWLSISINGLVFLSVCLLSQYYTSRCYLTRHVLTLKIEQHTSKLKSMIICLIGLAIGLTFSYGRIVFSDCDRIDSVLLWNLMLLLLPSMVMVIGCLWVYRCVKRRLKRYESDSRTD